MASVMLRIFVPAVIPAPNTTCPALKPAVLVRLRVVEAVDAAFVVVVEVLVTASAPALSTP